MTRVLRLLLISIVALPLWQPMAAQDELQAVKAFTGNGVKEVSPLKGTGVVTHHSTEAGHFCGQGKRSNAPSIKAGNQIYDYFDSYFGNTNSTATHTNLPINTSALTRSRDEGQMIYLASALGIESGVEIVGIQFYANAAIPDLGNNEVTLRLGETSDASVANYTAMTNNRANCQEVYTGSMGVSGSNIVFNFTTPYAYNGGNLIVDLVVNGAEKDAAINWRRLNNTSYGAGYYSYRNDDNTAYSSGALNTLPFIMVTYRKPHEGTASTRTIAVKDAEFLASKEYVWPYNASPANQQTSSLDEIATDPDQMIAMIRKVYMDQSLPGNKKRGFASDGSNSGETNQAVYYNGVGGIKYIGNNNSNAINTLSNYQYDDIYGWGIPGNPVAVQRYQLSNAFLGADYYARYTYLDLNQYEPQEEGLTLLLVELKDTYVDGSNNAIRNSTSYTTEYDRLRAFFDNTVKSVRIVSEARRTGEGLQAGTMFKIDCDKMNKFFLLAKGQLHLDHNSLSDQNDNPFLSYNNDFCVPPFYSFTEEDHLILSDSYTDNGFFDANTGELFWHMFEQFSPTMYNASAGADDLYQDLVNMQSFPVIHDCLGITIMNHQFMMYGPDSKDADCQDVRDMMFFIPDYRMLYHSNRGSDSQEYLNYHRGMQPSIGLYVIRQNAITPTAQEDDYYMLNLNWETNLDDFLPSEDQEFELLQIVVDVDGNESYQPVYYMNENGEYTDSLGNVVSTPVPIFLTMEAGRVKNYPNVYVERLEHGQQVTYAIRGRDKGHFLSLQYSNRQSYLIPGTDPTELVLLEDATHYSRYNPQNQENCYSNRIKISNTALGVTANQITSAAANQTIFTFTRKTSVNDENPVVFAIARLTKKTSGYNGNELTIEMQNQANENEFPAGKADVASGTVEYYAGYHHNPGATTWVHEFPFVDVNGVKYVDFNNLIIYDNFTVDVSENIHPNQYIYEVNFNINPDAPIDLGNGQSALTAHGNTFRVPVYKTSSQISGVFSKEAVDNDTIGSVGLPEDVEFGVGVQHSSITEILRYDTYRWLENDTRFIVNNVYGEDNEQDLPPTGLAMNHGEYYTISMNPSTNEETNGETSVSSGSGTATFVDEIPEAANYAAAYVYAPVVEVFAPGRDVNGLDRRDYNTYGGPLQSAAIGKMQVSVAQPSEEQPMMSDYNWTDSEGNKFAYYNFCLKFDQKSLPDDTYEIYKIRAWREVPTSMQGEEYSELSGRMGDRVNFEEITYPDCDASDNYQYPLGSGPKTFEVADANNVTQTYNGYTGTFGARKLRTSEDETGVIEELDMNFVVRIYFTKKSNLPTTQNGAPILRAEGTQDEGKYFIVEQTIPHTVLASQVVTGIQNLDARQAVGVKYYNVAGIESDVPFQGVNIVVTRYSDGSTTTTKVLK
ncbi:MAG: hypothetical protein J5629_01250 [Muribaculaceae bacterium]|nr:hypothetical protein [Muribaculaceae bacterium]